MSMTAPVPPLGLKLIVFDFDQTLSVYHVFKSLAGWAGRSPKEHAGLKIPKPYATSEKGQMQRMAELDLAEYRDKGGFSTAAFGGEIRIQEVYRQLESLQQLEVKMMICTKGYIGVVKKILSDLKLLPFFEEVYGNAGTNYGQTPYDEEVGKMKDSVEIKRFLGKPAESSWRSKDKLIQKLRTRFGYAKEEVVLIEDDPEEVQKATNVGETVLVKEAKGMNREHFDMIRKLIPACESQTTTPESDVKSRSSGRFRCTVM